MHFPFFKIHSCKKGKCYIGCIYVQLMHYNLLVDILKFYPLPPLLFIETLKYRYIEIHVDHDNFLIYAEICKKYQIKFKIIYLRTLNVIQH